VLEEGGVVVDTRSWAEYRAGHVPGTLSIPLNKSFTTWAGWLVPYDRDFFIIAPSGSEAALDEALRDLAMIGLDRAAGWFPAGTVGEWSRAGGATGLIDEVPPDQVLEAYRTGDAVLVDVRGQGEWDAGHVPGAVHIPLGYLADRLDEVPRDRPLVVHCLGGGRSAIAASVLKQAGFDRVANMSGGYQQWASEGKPTERGAPVAATA
jgi:hydroxyacylglutathione hydrolase